MAWYRIHWIASSENDELYLAVECDDDAAACEHAESMVSAGDRVEVWDQRRLVMRIPGKMAMATRH